MQTALIDPSDPSRGIQVISADLANTGSFYLEELDPFGEPVRHIPVDLTVEHPPAGGTTIAVLRLGLPDPLSQFFLTPNTMYRVTLVGADQTPGSALCSLASGAEMENTFQWTFITEQPCTGVDAPTSTLIRPIDGSNEQPLNQQIVLQFTNRMNPGSFAFNPSDITASTFGVYVNGVVSAGELVSGDPVPGTGLFNALNNTLTYTPATNLPEDSVIHVHLTSGIQDTCGNGLQTPTNGVQLFSFQTELPDTTVPDVLLVNPVPAITNLDSVQVSGSAEPNSIVSVSGGSQSVQTPASSSGLFNISVPLIPNQLNSFEVIATDASGNISPTTTTDINGDPLEVLHDNTELIATVLPVDTLFP